MNALLEAGPRSLNYVPVSPARPATGAKNKRRLPWAKIMAGSALGVVLASGIGYYVHYTAGFETTDDAFLEGDVHPISARINGTVLQVLVDDNAHVEAGQPLVKLDPADLDLAVKASEADLAQAKANDIQVSAQVSKARAEVAAASARIAQNEAQLVRAQLDFNRMAILTADEVHAVAKQEMDAARATLDATKAAKSSLEAERESTLASLAAAAAQKGVVQTQIQKAESMLQAAKLQAEYTLIRAPSAGRIARKTVEAGQRLQPGQPLLAVVSDDVWVVANFKENQLGQLRTGQKVEVKVDALDGHPFAGYVESFSPGTGARFSLLPPDNSTGNFTKIVQRVPVKILLSPESVQGREARLSPGLSTLVKVAVRS